MRPPQTREVCDAVTTKALPCQQDDHAERAHGREHIGEEIEQHACHPWASGLHRRDHADEGVTACEILE